MRRDAEQQNPDTTNETGFPFKETAMVPAVLLLAHMHWAF